MLGARGQASSGILTIFGPSLSPNHELLAKSFLEIILWRSMFGSQFLIWQCFVLLLGTVSFWLREVDDKNVWQVLDRILLSQSHFCVIPRSSACSKPGLLQQVLGLSYQN